MLLTLRRLGSKPPPLTLNVERIGNENSRPLIICHGLFGHIQNWRSVGRALSTRLNRRIILTDLRNHGASPRADSMSYEEMAQDVIHLAKTEGRGDQVDLLGHSMGGKTAMVASTTHPDIFRKIIIEDVAPRRYTLNTKIFRQYIGGMRSLDLTQSRATLAKELEKSIPEKPVRDFILTNLAIENGQQYWRVNLDAVTNYLESILNTENMEGTFPREALFLHGAASNYLLPSDHDKIYHHFPLAKIESIPEAGHWLHVEKPNEFIASVTKFLV